MVQGVKKYSWRDEPATDRQIIAIRNLSYALGIVVDAPYSKGECFDLIDYLTERVDKIINGGHPCFPDKPIVVHRKPKAEKPEEKEKENEDAFQFRLAPWAC